jgi:hypothetical protein
VSFRAHREKSFSNLEDAIYKLNHHRDKWQLEFSRYCCIRHNEAAFRRSFHRTSGNEVRACCSTFHFLLMNEKIAMKSATAKNTKITGQSIESICFRRWKATGDPWEKGKEEDVFLESEAL